MAERSGPSAAPREGSARGPSPPPGPLCGRGAAGPGALPMAGPGAERGGAGPGGQRSRAGLREPGRRGMAAGGALKALPALLLLLLAVGTLGKPTARQERARPGAAQHDDRPGFQYDHEAFLGKEEARSFDQLSPEESRERLG